MTHREFIGLLEQLNLPIAYGEFKEMQKPPFLVVLNTGNQHIPADDKVYFKIKNYRVELYTSRKDVATEELLEQLFDDNEIFYEVDEVYIDSEKLHERIYTLQI